MTGETKTMNDLVDDLVAYAEDDYTGFWLVLKFVREHPEVCGDGGEQEAVLALCARLFENGVDAGEFEPGNDHYVKWNLAPDAALAKIKEEWAALDHEPLGGEVVWFTRGY